ncbi:MAG: hypothetical protein LC667_20070 [Thioalkalivibrio sp.]|nr:hypothetical protein [Thioalkalivibrio sp.]
MPGFVGFQVLQDLDGDDRPESVAKVDQRFLLVRLVRSFVDEEPDSSGGLEWADRVARARSEVSKKTADGGHPFGAFESLFDALAAQRHGDVADGLVALGERAEAEGHTHGALEIYRCAFDAAAAVAYPAAAVDAARFQGRVLRRAARWDEAIRAYGVANDVAVAAELWGKAVWVSVGLASVRQENGNLPAARTGLEQALDLASRSDDREAIAIVHHGLLGLEHAVGNNEAALRHGWNAVANHTDSTQRLRCLAGLAGVLVDFGDFSAAEDAWSIVSGESSELYYRTYAHDALAYLAALRGDLGEFERQASLCDDLGWESGPRSAMAEILYYRGLSYRALGLRDAAERWLARAVRHAEEFNFNRTLFRAEAAIRTLALERKEAELAAERNATPSAPTEVRERFPGERRRWCCAASPISTRASGSSSCHPRRSALELSSGSDERDRRISCWCHLTAWRERFRMRCTAAFRRAAPTGWSHGP